ncbi:MFS transporter [Caballeronia fortuita]|uniref:MFS transporter n=1 Tax=Caballeronia fortuita TaxID=1777138 RepID=A0A158E0D1_9BURK|nr:MFS transporter [Caballeronia fortuita]SAL00329.1 MFS transporter [Caballeronia fortuita]
MNKTINDADPRRWAALCVLLTGTLLPPLDFFIVNVTLPVIRSQLGASDALTQLVVSVYAAAYAVTLILGGRLGDLYGRRKVYIGGMLGFGLASAVCGLATSASVLIVGRLLQGVAAAITAPQSLASIHAIFPAEEKSRALGFYGATFGLASVGGQILGGALVSLDLLGLGWRSVFLINLPVIVVAVPAAMKLLSESKAADARQLDVKGALLLATGLLALIVPLIEGREQGWPWWCAVLLSASPLLLLLFWRYERRVELRGGSPLVVFSLFESRGLRRSLLATFFFYALASFFLIFAVFQQSSLGRNALSAGLAILPLGVGFLLGPLLSARLIKWLGAGTPIVGMAMEALGLFATAGMALAAHANWLWLPLFFIGLGQGIALPTLVRLNVDQVPARWAGLAAGLVNSTLQISAAIFVAVIGGLFFTLAPDGASVEAVTSGFAISCAVIGLMLAIASIVTRRSLAASSSEHKPRVTLKRETATSKS